MTPDETIQRVREAMAALSQGDIDAAGALVLEAASDDAPGILGWDLGCDGSATGLLEIQAGGSRLPSSAATRT